MSRQVSAVRHCPHGSAVIWNTAWRRDHSHRRANPSGRKLRLRTIEVRRIGSHHYSSRFGLAAPALAEDLDKKPQSSQNARGPRKFRNNIGCILQVMMINVSDVAGKPKKRRSGCPVSIALEMFGDRWSLLIIRDLMVRGYRTF